MAKKKKDDSEDNGVDPLDALFAKETFADPIEMAELQAGYRVFSTGFPHLDMTMGFRDPILFNMGAPERSVFESFGDNSSLKTALKENLTINIIRTDPTFVVLVMDIEESTARRWDSYNLTPQEKRRIKHINCCNGNTDDDLKTFEDACSLVFEAVKDRRVKAVFIDSVAAIPTQELLMDANGNTRSLTDNEKMGARATMLGKFIRKFHAVNRCAILWMINQTTEAITTGFSHPQNARYAKKTTGGRFMEFASQIRIEHKVTPIETETDNELSEAKLLLGWNASFRLMKNKFCNPTSGRTAKGKFYFSDFTEVGKKFHDSIDGVGFDKTNQILMITEYLTRKGFIKPEEGVEKKAGGNWAIQGHNEKGLLPALSYIKENPDVKHKLEMLMYDNANNAFSPLSPKDEEPPIETIF